MVRQLNYTLTNLAAPCGRCSHDAITRYLGGERITPRLGWEHGRDPGVATIQGYVGCDDPGVDKNASSAIALGRDQYRGNAKAVIQGSGVGTGVYVPPGREQVWRIDARLDEPDGDGNTKRAPVRERRVHGGHQTQWPFPAVRMDPWDATNDLRLTLEGLQQVYECPVTAHRQVDDAGGPRPDGRVAALAWKAAAGAPGQRIKRKGFPNAPKGRRFRGEGSTHRTAWVVTNAPTQASTAATREVGGFRWKIEPVHREGQHVTGLERGQCRKARIQRKPLGGAFLVWGRLKALTARTGRPGYPLTQGLLDDDLIHPLNNPSLKRVLA